MQYIKLDMLKYLDMEFKIVPPIEVFNGTDPDKIGRHYSKLHQSIHQNNYQEQGFDAKTKYKVKKRKNGKNLVELFVDLTKSS